MTFEQLSFFLNLAKHKHFTNAAEEAAISQSSLSKHIGKLESELGVKLMTRNTRNVSLTPAGEEFLSYARALTQEYHEMLTAMRSYKADYLAENIKLGSSARMVKATLIAPMASFLEEYPGIAVSVLEGSTSYIMDLLTEGSIDVAFVAHLFSSLEERSNLDAYDLKQYEQHTVIEDEYYLIVSKRHSLAKRDMVDWIDLKGERLVLLDESYSINSMARRCCKLSGFEPEFVFESNQIDAILGLVEANSGHTLMSRQVASAAGFSGISMIPLSRPIRRNSVMIYSKRRRNLRYLNAFIQYLLSFYAATS